MNIPVKFVIDYNSKIYVVMSSANWHTFNVIWHWDFMIK